ncbi:CG34112, partial [Drosophila busckii]
RTMAASHEPTMHYLDSILNEEEKRCDQYSHQWRNFTISRSGRFRSKNKKRDVVDGKLFDVTGNHYGKENDNKVPSNNTTNTGTGTPSSSSMRGQRDKAENYKSFYETNL